MSPNEILQMIIKNSITKRQAIEDTNDLIYEVQKDYRDFIYKLSEELNDYGKSIQKCPLCGGDIVQIEKYSEDMGEYLGQPVKQDIIRYGCEECSYIVD
ncbi:MULTISPECIES: hypothetical protein [unclassified Clostridium]|nr:MULTISPECIES: hypothetical protein [unclassified Clostridium]